jgi:hypothetical protein
MYIGMYIGNNTNVNRDVDKYKLIYSLLTVRCDQGDQMRLWVFRPKFIPTHLLLKVIHNFYRGKVAQKW